MVAIKKPVSYEDLLAVPGNLVAEIVNGELVTSPRPAYRHAAAASRLGGELSPFDRQPGGDRPGGWIILDEPELHLGPRGEQVVVPDLAGWRRERMPKVPDVAWTDLVPDWICEVASPSTQRLDRVTKLPIYHAAGVEWLWLVTPLTMTIEVLHRRVDGVSWTLADTAVGPEARRLPPFEAMELDIERLWEID